MRFVKCNCRPPGGIWRVSYGVKKPFDRCSHETDSSHDINMREVALFVILKEPYRGMRFGCQIWFLKDRVKVVNREGTLDLLEKPLN